MTTIHGGAGCDHIVGGEGFNTIYGDAGDDVIDAGIGATEVDGGEGDDLITWAYAPLSDNTLKIDGGLGEGDTLDVTLDELANVVDLAKANSDVRDTTAALTIDGIVLSLEGTENVKIDARQEGDQISIDDLLGYVDLDRRPPARFGQGQDVAGRARQRRQLPESIPTDTVSSRTTPRCAKALTSTATTWPRAASISSMKTALPAWSR